MRLAAMSTASTFNLVSSPNRTGLVTRRGGHLGELRWANEQCDMHREPRISVTNGDAEILPLAEVAEMTRTSVATLRYCAPSAVAAQDHSG